MELQQDIQFQDLNWARPKIKARIHMNKLAGDGTSVSGLFTMLRKERHLSLIGDYSIFWIILDELKETSKTKIHNALYKSEEYRNLPKREKMWWLKSFLYDNQQSSADVTKIETKAHRKGKKA